MISKDNTAGVIVLYDPPAGVLDHVRAAAGEVSRLYVMDNGPLPDPLLVESLTQLPNVDYVPLGHNTGLAGALNAAVSRALRDGFQWLLTLDQDTRVEPAMVAEMRRLYCHLDNDRVAVISPYHEPPNRRRPKKLDHDFVASTMTTGCMNKLSACDAVGRFRTDLFLDAVYHEYCMRLGRNGHLILRATHATLEHWPGKPAKGPFGLFYVSHHNPTRHYYITRNRFVVAQEYGVSFLLCLLVSCIQASLIVVYERDRLEKLRSMWRGFRDYRSHRLGRADLADYGDVRV